ncbi:hypothetical protein [Xanthocytophaga flava]|uniref:hypothetical protein n=1 Tax=Xanthocytophaga flava TaxID=3048013 RepID=UPI0028D87BBF|nr:hypothetical protein [Xanthocytophaga flavus]MDJ1470274.1 hypothetical protein [Xanthocytophaga flavus]
MATLDRHRTLRLHIDALKHQDSHVVYNSLMLAIPNAHLHFQNYEHFLSSQQPFMTSPQQSSYYASAYTPFQGELIFFPKLSVDDVEMEILQYFKIYSDQIIRIARLEKKDTQISYLIGLQQRNSDIEESLSFFADDLQYKFNDRITIHLEYVRIELFEDFLSNSSQELSLTD